MGPPGFGDRNLIHAQREESAEEIIAPLPVQPQTIPGNDSSIGDAEWLSHNLLSLGR